MYETLSITEQYYSLFGLAAAMLIVWWWFGRLVNWSTGIKTKVLLDVIKKDPIACALVLIGKWAVIAYLVGIPFSRFVG